MCTDDRSHSITHKWLLVAKCEHTCLTLFNHTQACAVLEHTHTHTHTSRYSRASHNPFLLCRSACMCARIFRPHHHDKTRAPSSPPFLGNCLYASRPQSYMRFLVCSSARTFAHIFRLQQATATNGTHAYKPTFSGNLSLCIEASKQSPKSMCSSLPE